MSYEFVGADARDESGISVSSAGDVDGDGLADLLIGARYADGVNNAENDSGSTYLISAADLAALDAADGVSDGIIDLTYVAATGSSYEFVGQDVNDNSGSSVSSAGDVDGDGLTDLLIGAPDANGVNNAENDSGSTYLISAADLAALDAADGASDGIIDLTYVAPTGSSYEFVGDDPIDFCGDRSGRSVCSAGDVDGDGLADLLITAYYADGVSNAEGASGSTYLISAADLTALDAADGMSDGIIDLANVAASGTSYEFVGEDAGDFSGWSVSSAGDVDGDGLADLLIGALYAAGVDNAATFSGSTYLIAAADLAALDAADGASDGFIDLTYVAPTGTSYEFVGEDAGDYSGYSVSSAGDVDGDGLADLLIGARSANGFFNTVADSGSTYLILAADLAALDAVDRVDGVIDLTSVAAIGISYEFRGQDTGDNSGWSVSSAGDVDGDGLADLLIGAYEADGVGNAEGGSGSTYLIEADQLKYYDGLDGRFDGVIYLSYVSAGPNTAASGSVLITGTAEEDETLTADAAGLSDEDGLGTFSYQWLRDGVAIEGATSGTYQLGQDDVGAEISVRVSYTDGREIVERVTSAATSAVTNVNDAVSGSVLITGTAVEGETLTADASDLSDEDGLGTFSYQWLRDGVAIDSATSATYQLGQYDVGAEISVRVSYTDSQGGSESTTSAATSAVTNLNDAVSGSVLIFGTASEGQLLAADASGLSDEDGLGTLSYQWLRDGVAIDGGTAFTYQLGQDDVGAEISVTVSYTDGSGTSESVTSGETLISSAGFSGTSSPDVLQGGISGTSAAAGDGDDTVSATAGSNTFDGGDGSDLLIGGIDGDELIGGAGNDILIGDVTTHVAGADILDGGAGDDLMEGGAGSDTFVFRPDEGSDTIGSIDLDYDVPSSSTISGADFESGVDMIALSGFDFTDGSDAIDAVSDVNGVATFSADGTTITFAGLTTADLTASDFAIL